VVTNDHIQIQLLIPRCVASIPLFQAVQQSPATNANLRLFDIRESSWFQCLAQQLVLSNFTSLTCANSVPDKRRRADSETSHEYSKRRCLSEQRSSTPLIEVEDFCERSENEVPEQLPSPSLTKSGEVSLRSVYPYVLSLTMRSRILCKHPHLALRRANERRSRSIIFHLASDHDCSPNPPAARHPLTLGSRLYRRATALSLLGSARF